MGLLFIVYLQGEQVFVCAGNEGECGTHLACPEDLVSKNFNGAHGRAYLFEKVVNVRTAEKVERMMTTGLHVVMDIACIKCGQVLGWKYERAYDETQKYKEGKFILERTLIKESPSRSDEEVVCVSYSHGVPTATVSAVRPRAATSAAS